MSGHTPGPWSYRSQPHDDWGVVRAGRYFICQARNPDSTPELESEARRQRFDPYEANARLIAAAPDLVLAGDAMLVAFAEGVDWNDEQRAAYELFASVLTRATARATSPERPAR